MGPKFNETVEVHDTGANATIVLNANRGAVYAGGHGKAGSLRLKDADGTERVTIGDGGVITIRSSDAQEVFEIDGRTGTLTWRDTAGAVVLRFVAGRGGLTVGGTGNAGFVLIQDERGEVTVRHDGEHAMVRAGADGRAGRVELDGGEGRATVELDGKSATVAIGADGAPGSLKVLDAGGGLSFQVAASLATLRGTLVVGASNAPGTIAVMDATGRPAIVAEGNKASLQLGNIGNAGDLVLLDNETRTVMQADGLTATLAVGGGNKPGSVVLRDGDGTEVGRLSANEAGLFLGREGRAGEILILDRHGRSSFGVDGGNGVVSVGTGDTRVVIDGKEGDIKLSGADCAEEFEIAGPGATEPGTVLVIDGGRELGACRTPYDRRVAGVVSGASGLRPALVLNRGEVGRGRSPVALSGRVYCKVDASYGGIEAGDLLTTSATPGHAMKAADQSRAHGAVLGKAMDSLEHGTGLIPVLVSLL